MYRIERLPRAPALTDIALSSDIFLIFYYARISSFIAKSPVWNHFCPQVVSEGKGGFEANRVLNWVERFLTSERAASSKPAMRVSRCRHVIEPLLFSFIRTEES